MYSMLIKVTVVLLAHGDAHASVEDALEVPSFDALEHARHKIVTRAKEINHAATVSDFERQGRMPDRDSIPNADCVFVPKRFIGGNRAMIYRRVNKSGSQTVLALIRALAKELAPRGTEPKFQSYSCSAPELEIARSQGAVDFAIVRDPLDRWASRNNCLARTPAPLANGLLVLQSRAKLRSNCYNLIILCILFILKTTTTTTTTGERLLFPGPFVGRAMGEFGALHARYGHVGVGRTRPT